MRLVNGGAVLIFLGVSACSSVQKVEYPPSANPAHEIAILQLDLDKAKANQYDLLAIRPMERAESYLRAAERERIEPRRVRILWDDIGYARAYLNQARNIYFRRQPAMASTLQARKNALNAGATRLALSERELRNIDARLRADKEPARRLQADYEALEVMAVQENKLGQVRELITEAVMDGALYRAPQTLGEARQALRAADAAIARNPRRRQAYQDQVIEARQTARWLTAVNARARTSALQSDERMARRMVRRDEEVSELRSRLKGTELEAEMQARALTANAQALREARQEAQQQGEMNRAWQTARKRFSDDEADVYREGDKLLIRLKKVGFRQGSAKLPDASEPLMTKVKAVIRDLHPKDLVVEGHTDATGSAAINNKVSAARAETVADYLEESTGIKNVEAVGAGENTPLRSNKTSEGRATNRRVDLILTPTVK